MHETCTLQKGDWIYATSLRVTSTSSARRRRRLTKTLTTKASKDDVSVDHTPHGRKRTGGLTDAHRQAYARATMSLQRRRDSFHATMDEPMEILKAIATDHVFRTWIGLTATVYL